MYRIASLVSVFVLIGCGGTDVDLPPTIPVTGTVTYNGEALADAVVQFVPKSGTTGEKPASGRTDESGAFTLRTPISASAEAEGAMTGEYFVLVQKMTRIEVPQPESPPAGLSPEEEAKFMAEQAMKLRNQKIEPPTSLIPKEYGQQQTTPLSATVDPSNYTFSFTLSDNQ